MEAEENLLVRKHVHVGEHIARLVHIRVLLWTSDVPFRVAGVIELPTDHRGSGYSHLQVGRQASLYIDHNLRLDTNFYTLSCKTDHKLRLDTNINSLSFKTDHKLRLDTNFYTLSYNIDHK